MKAPNFDYVRAGSVQQAIDELVVRGDSAQILAGGQSLMAMLNLRLSAPSCLIDIAGSSRTARDRTDRKDHSNRCDGHACAAAAIGG